MQMCQMEDIYIQTADGNKSCGWLHHRTFCLHEKK